MQTGAVKWFDGQEGFGFIPSDDGSNDIFVNVSAVQRDGLASRQVGHNPSFELQHDRCTGKVSTENLQVA